MPRCIVRRRHTVVRSFVGPFGVSVHRFVRSCIFMSGELQVLKVGQYAKSDILVEGFGEVAQALGPEGYCCG